MGVYWCLLRIFSRPPLSLTSVCTSDTVLLLGWGGGGKGCMTHSGGGVVRALRAADEECPTCASQTQVRQQPNAYGSRQPHGNTTQPRPRHNRGKQEPHQRQHCLGGDGDCPGPCSGAVDHRAKPTWHGPPEERRRDGTHLYCQGEPPLLCHATPPPPNGLGGCVWMHLVNGTGNSPVSGTADPRSSQTGQVIRGLR